MQVVTSLNWAFLLGGILLIWIALFWGFKGEVQTVVQGQGILLKEGSIYDVVSLGTGQVKKNHIRVEDSVVKGQVIAELSLPELDHQIKEAVNRLEKLEAEKEMIWSLGDKATHLKLKTLANQRRNLEAAIAIGEDRLTYLKKEYDHEKNFLEKELTTRSRVREAQTQYESAAQEIMGYKSDLTDIESREMDLSAGFEKERFALNYEISQARLKIGQLEEKRHLESRIVSPHNGRVLEIFKNSGKVIQIGEPMASIEVTGGQDDPLSAHVYFQPRDGNKIKTRMAVRIIPSTVKVEESGYLLGSIRQVSGFPASQKGMLRVLQNQDLVSSLSSGGAPIAVAASLIPAANKDGQYKWSSGKGPATRVESGTLCMASVVVKTQPPISLVLPYLKRKLFGIGEAEDDK